MAGALPSLKTWWSATVPIGDTYDYRSLCVVKIGGVDAIVTASFEGLLSIFSATDRSAEGLLYQSQLSMAILEVHTVEGRSGDGGNSELAVLHPNKLVMYTFKNQEGLKLDIRMELALPTPSPAINAVVGRFGNQTRPQTCVQTMDGTLAFFGHTSLNFARQLSGFVLPGPLAYCAPTESLVTSSPDMRVSAYRFYVLASAYESPELQGDASQHTKKLEPDWSTNIGESAIDLACNNDIVLVLGERSLFWLDAHHGSVKTCRRLASPPSAIRAYRQVERTTYSLLAMHDQTLMVFKDDMVIWVCRMDGIPVALSLTSIGSLQGVIVALDESGGVRCCYLGTEPALPTVARADELDYETLDGEMRRLQKAIRNSIMEETPISFDDVLKISLDETSQTTEGVLVKVTVAYVGRGSIRNVQLSFGSTAALVATPSTVVIQLLGSDQPSSQTVETTLTIRADAFIPTSAVLLVSASYSKESGEARCSTEQLHLPLKMFMQASAPAKTASFKFTLMSSIASLDLRDLFKEYAADGAGWTPAAVAFCTTQGEALTLLTTKGKYRIQTNDLAAACLLTQELIFRFGKQAKGSSGKLIFNEDLPVAELLAAIDRRFEARCKLSQLNKSLAANMAQFRAVQKRLLAKYKDQTPTPLDNLDVILEMTQSQIMDACEELEVVQQEFAVCNNRLECVLNLFIELLRHRDNSKEDISKRLHALLAPALVTTQEEGWEEYILAALSHEAHDTVGPKDMSELEDTQELKEAITKLFATYRVAPAAA